MIKIYWVAIFFTVFSLANGQKPITPGYKLAMVYYENHDKNFILIPNMGKFHSFKVYHKPKQRLNTNLLERKGGLDCLLDINHFHMKLNLRALSLIHVKLTIRF